MATVLRAQVRLKNISTLAQDTAVNTYHFRSSAGSPATDAVLAHTALETFYQGLQAHLSPCIATPIDVTIYDLADAEPRTPMGTDTIVMDIDNVTPLPNEVAICLSYHAAGGSGVPVGRRRGRIYLGPWGISVLAAGDFGAIVNDDALDDMENLANQFLDNTNSGSCIWSVFSPSTAGSAPWTESELMASSFPVVAGHIDNAFDTMRSRGIVATERRIIDGTI